MKITFRVLVILFITSIFLSSCEDDIEDTGLDLLQKDKLISVDVDTLNNFIFTAALDDSLAEGTTALLGTYNYPYLGKLKSEFVAPYYFALCSFDKDEVAKSLIDDETKVEIIYDYKWAGYGSEILDFKVYIINELFDTTSLKNPKKLIENPQDSLLIVNINNKNFLYATDSLYGDTLELTGDAKKLLLRRLLSGYEYINSTNADTVDSVSNMMRANSFPGLHFSIDKNTTNQSLIYFDNLFIKLTRGVKSMYLGSYGAELSLYNHDFSSVGISKKISIKDGDTLDNGEIYVKPLSGLKTGIDMSAMDSWFSDPNIVINKAILKIPAYTADTVNYPLMNKILLSIYSKEDTTRVNSIDVLNEEYEKFTVDTNGLNYTFYITDFLIAYHYYRHNVSETLSLSDYKIELSETYSSSSPNRAIMLTKNANLEVTYTKY